MEPFGLLNLLKSLLPDGNAEDPSAPSKDEEKAPPPPPPPPQEEQERHNACAAFLEAHERKAGRGR